MGFNLYDENGWININEIAKLDKWLNVIIGPREVGKTYFTKEINAAVETALEEDAEEIPFE